MRILVLIIFLASILSAHKLNLFLYEENNKIYLNSYFASGNPCIDCKIEIYDEKKELLEIAKTDEKGNYNFKKLANKLIVKVEAIGGHAVENQIEVKSLAKEEEKRETNSILQSLIAVFLIALIFIALKRFKK